MHEPPCLAITLHDVAPATLPACRQLAALVESLDPRAPVTLLVVPDFHGHGRADQAPEFRAWVDARLARGDEVALHGFRHVDTAPRPTRPGGWVRRQLLGGGEAEFAALASGPARRRIEAGLSLLRHCGWRPSGFVAPGWHLGSAARGVLAALPFAYTASLRALYRLPDWTELPAWNLGLSVGSAVERAVSRGWNRSLGALCTPQPGLRVGLQPEDARHASAMEFWRRTLATLLERRAAVTQAQLARTLARPGAAAQVASA